MYISRVALLAALVTCAPSLAGSSARAGENVFPAHATRQIVPAGTTQIIAGSDVRSDVIAQFDPQAPRRVIVQFSARPLGRGARLATEIEGARAPYRRFLTDLATLASPGGAPPLIKRRFESSFNGVALSAPPELIERIRALPYVTAVSPDDTVRALLAESVPLIRADSLRIATGATGHGVDVSVIDTGIDYTHPALGGCFGPDCRVCGGYDFVNDDPDPRDDNGHGTHVAGIIGANGPGVVGVAPGVRFHAYKVLAATGFGSSSDVIAAIDRSLDPDQNPLTDDAVDVINLSLGSSGDANSPTSQAVDAAVRAGVVVAVAAGNGSRYFRINAPGASRLAITVGASTKEDTVASFSSRGPALPDYDIKPDVVAPGVAIRSCWPGGGTQVLSGTSMATPHVAGVAALMLELHPEWTPAIIKARMMNTAVDLEVAPFVGGAGRIDALAAATTRLVVSPGSLSFGWAPSAAPLWSADDTLEVRNTGASALSVGTESTGPVGPKGPPERSRNTELGRRLPSPRSGDTGVTLFPSDLVLDPGESVSLEATLLLDHVPAAGVEPFAYSGRITARSDSGSASIPFAVIKSPRLVVRLTGQSPQYVLMHDRSSVWSMVEATNSVASFLVPEGTYDLIASFGGEATRVVREGVLVSDSVDVSISQSEAIYEIRRAELDEHGAPLAATSGFMDFRHKNSTIGVYTLGSVPSVMHYSPVSAEYELQWLASDAYTNTVTHVVNGYLRGIQRPRVFTNTPADLRHIACRYHPPPGIAEVTPLLWLCDGPLRANIFTIWGPGMPRFAAPFVKNVYVLPPSDPALKYKSWYQEVYDNVAFDPANQTPLFITPYMIADASGPVRGYVFGDSTQPVVTLADTTLEVGYGPPTWFGRFVNGRDGIDLESSIGTSRWMFLTQQGSWSDHYLLPFQISHDGAVIETGEWQLGDRYAASGYLTRALEPGAYAFQVTDDRYSVAGAPGRATVTCSFDTRLEDRSPPYMTELGILTNGAVTDVVPGGGGAENRVRFSLGDDVGVTSVALSYREESIDPWAPIAVKKISAGFEAAIPQDGGYLSLLIEAADAAGNRLSYEMSPAVFVSGPRSERSRAPAGSTPAASAAPAAVLALEVAAPSRGRMQVRYSLPDARPATLEVLDVAGRRVIARRLDMAEAGWRTLDIESARGWRPGIYWVRLLHEGRALTRKACVIR